MACQGPRCKCDIDKLSLLDDANMTCTNRCACWAHRGSKFQSKTVVVNIRLRFDLTKKYGARDLENNYVVFKKMGVGTTANAHNLLVNQKTQMETFRIFQFLLESLPFLHVILRVEHS